MKTFLRIATLSMVVAFAVGCAKKAPADNKPAAAPAAMSACCKMDAANAHSCQHGGGPCCDSHAAK